MVIKHVISLLLVVLCSGDISNNEVEISSEADPPYSDRRCDKPPTSADISVVPDEAQIELYQTYTIICNTGHLVQGDKSIVGVDPVCTCLPTDSGAELSPTENPPTCAETNDLKYGKSLASFYTQVQAAVDAGDTEYQVTPSNVGCWARNAAGYGPTDGLENCSSGTYATFLDVGCTQALIDEEKVMVGYNSLRIIVEDGTIWGKDIIDDPNLTMYMDCIDPGTDSVDVCLEVNKLPAVSSTRLYVLNYFVPVRPGQSRDQTEFFMNIVADQSDVKYRLRCDDGYSFENDIDESTVYGYCTSGGSAPANNQFYAYTTAAPDTQINCYAKCSANPTNAMEINSLPASSGGPVFEKLFMPSLKKGQTFTVDLDQIVCAESHSLGEGAPSSYVMTCEGADTDADPYGGALTCGDSCPKCYAMCPANPTSEHFTSSSDVMFESITMAAMKKDGTFNLLKENVVCPASYALAEDAADTYQLSCVIEGEEAKISCTTCPKCYAKCPANPTGAESFVDGETPVFQSITLQETLYRQTVTVSKDVVVCAEGHSLESGGPNEYEFTCQDANVDTDIGLLSCGENCPVCYAQCPENPVVAKFAADKQEDIAFESLTMPSLAYSADHDLAKENVQCADGAGLPDSGPASFGVTCGAADPETDLDEGILSCDPCPKCEAQCLANPAKDFLEVPEGSGIASLVVAENVNRDGSITVSKDDIQCEENYAMSADAADNFEFTCGAEGIFTCGEACPICQGTCNWPAAVEGNEGYDFQYVDDSKNEETRPETAIPGINHIEAYCTNDTLALLGPRFLSCVTNNTMEFDTKGYEDGTSPTCQSEEKVCEAPVTTGGVLQTNGNIKVGEVYTFTCDEGYMFDLEDQTTFQSDERREVQCVASADEAALVNSALPAISCYKGCAEITEFDGTISPEVIRQRSAPYNDGQAVTFECKEGYKMEDASMSTLVCSEGKIGASGAVPKCIKNGSASPTLSSLLGFSSLLLAYVLL